VNLDGKVIAQAPLVAINPVEEGGFFKRLWDAFWMWWDSDCVRCRNDGPDSRRKPAVCVSGAGERACHGPDSHVVYHRQTGVEAWGASMMQGHGSRRYTIHHRGDIDRCVNGIRKWRCWPSG
jgi:hypothetical protein